MEPQHDTLTANAAAEQPVASEKPASLSKPELLNAIKLLAEKDAADITRDDVNRLRVQFLNFRHDEIAAEKAAFVENGGAEDDFQPAANADEETFKAALLTIKEKKAEFAARQEAERQENLQRKNLIIAEIDAAGEDTDNVHRQLDRVRELQQQFKETGEVPAPEVSDIWKRYQLATERFYDQLKVNKDLRDLDFKKNLDSKTLICERAEALLSEPDIVVAFRALQDLHGKWREIGPVAKEYREEIWNRFKDAGAEINKKYQAFFEERKAVEQQNESAKLALIERVEAIKPAEISGFAAWDEATKQVIGIQEEWKKLGFASRKVNAKLFTRFRSLCDEFFAAKAAYYKQVKDNYAENLAKKISLCEQAEELRDSTDWKKASEALIALQEQWRAIGAVPKAQSDAIWKRFRGACDVFFENKKQNSSERRRSEAANLKAKRDIIAQLTDIKADGEDRKAAIARVRELMKEYQAVGHVPFREKDKLHNAYREQVSRLHDELDMSTAKAAMAAFESSVSDLDGADLSRQRDKLVRSLEMKKNEIKTFENNLGFFNSRSKSGEAMLRDMQHRIARLRDEQTNIEKRIKLIDDKLNG